MKHRMLNTVCAHPIAISWCLGAAVLDIAAIFFVAGGVSGLGVLLRFPVVLYLTLALVPPTLLGFFAAIPVFWPISAICRRLNGAPFDVGDTVLVLSGPHKGTTAQVYKITTGQAGEKLLRVDIGPGHRADFSDLFEECSVLRVHAENETGGPSL